MIDLTSRAGPDNPISVLRRFSRQQRPTQFCELCSTEIATTHRHLFEVASRRALCACEPCALRFEKVKEGRFKLIPRNPRALVDFKMTEEDWESLALPINLAFFYRASTDNVIRALYPSPGGITESLLPLPSWLRLEAENPALGGMDADVEALLVNRVGSTRQYYLTPIDTCYELAGIIRVHWRGLAGGEAVWQHVQGFFIALKNRSLGSLCLS